MIGFIAAIIAIIFSLNAAFINTYKKKGMFTVLLVFFFCAIITLITSFFLSLHATYDNSFVFLLIAVSVAGFFQALIVILMIVSLMIKASD